MYSIPYKGTWTFSLGRTTKAPSDQATSKGSSVLVYLNSMSESHNKWYYYHAQSFMSLSLAVFISVVYKEFWMFGSQLVFPLQESDCFYFYRQICQCIRVIVNF